MDELFEKRKKIIYEFICDEFYVPMKLKELSMLLQVPKDQKGELKAVMDNLEKEGKVHVTQKGKYIKGEAKQLRGMFQANARGFGFVTVEGESEDIFISEDDMNGAMQGDEVEVVITKAPEGMRRLSASTNHLPSLACTRSMPAMWANTPWGGHMPSHWGRYPLEAYTKDLGTTLFLRMFFSP